MTRLPTFSNLNRAATCAPSAVLPRWPTTGGRARERGLAIHRYLELVPQVGAAAALKQIPSTWEDGGTPAGGPRRDCEAINLEELPLGPNTRQEVAFAYDARADAGRELGAGLNREYPELGPAELCGTADVVLRADDVVYVADFKSGWRHVPRARDNLQVRALALAACRAYDVEEAEVAIIRLDRDGHAVWDTAGFDMFDLVAIAAQLRGLVAAIEAEAAWIAERGAAAARVTYGDHCTFCEAVRSCPAVDGFARRLVEHATGKRAGEGMPIAEMVRLVEVAERYGSELRQVLETMVANAGVVKLPDGRRYGRVEKTRDAFANSAAVKLWFEQQGLGELLPLVQKDAEPKMLVGGLAAVAEALVAREGGGLKKPREALLRAEMRRRGVLLEQRYTTLGYVKGNE